MADSHASTITAMLEDLQRKLQVCKDLEEWNSLRLAIKHLRTTQDLLNPASNLRRSRRKMLRKEEYHLDCGLNGETPNLSDPLDASQLDCAPNESLSSDVTSVRDVTSPRKCTDDRAGDKKQTERGVDSSTSERKDILHTPDSLVPTSVPSKTDAEEVFESTEHSVLPSETSTGASRRESRSRSPFPHLLKLKGSKSSKESESKPLPLTSPDEKAPSLGKRRFSKRFRKRSSKSLPGESSDSAHKPSTPEGEANLSLNLAPSTDDTKQVEQNLDSYPHPVLLATTPLDPSIQESSPLPVHSDNPEPLSPKKGKSNEHHAQRRRSVQVIRRAIDRLFTPKQKHSAATELTKKKNDSSHQISTTSAPDQHTTSKFEVKSALVYSESSRLSPHSQSTPCVENDKIMAEVMQPPQDVAPTPNEPDFFNQIDDVIVEESADVEQQRQPTLESEVEESKNEAEQQQPLTEESVSEPVCVEESSFDTKDTSASESKSSFNTNNSSKNTSSINSTSPPWAANQVKKNSFKSVQFATPTSRPAKEPASAPPAFNQASDARDQSPPVSRAAQSFSSDRESTSSSRFGNRELSASFKTYRPSYKLPEHVKTRAESFRLHRPKDFIKASSAEEPAPPSSSERVALNSVTPISNRTAAPFTSTPLHKEQFTTPSNLTSTPKTSSLQRSESCKENHSTQESSPLIPIVRGNKRRSRGILSRILSSKIDSEKANQPSIVPTPQKSIEKPLSPAAVNSLQSVCEENAAPQRKLPLIDDTTERDKTASDTSPTQPEIIKPPSVEEHVKKSFSEELKVAQVSLQPEVEPEENKATAPKLEPSEVVSCVQSSSEKPSTEVLTFLTSLIDQAVLFIEEENFKQGTNFSSTSADKKDSASFPPSNQIGLKKLETVPQALAPTESNVQSKELDSSCTNVVEELFSPVVVKPVAECPVLLLENLPETSLEDLDCFQDQSDSSLSINSSESDEFYEDEMEGRYSLRSRRHEGTGSVKSRIQATESRNGGTELKRNRQGVDSRALRNAEGVKSRMNKFAAMMSPTSPPGKSSVKKTVSKSPDANNNINGEVPQPKSRSSVKPQTKPNTIETTKQIQKKTVANVLANGHAVDAVKPMVNGKMDEDKSSPQPLDQKPECSNTDQAAAIDCNNKRNASNSSALPVNEVNGVFSPQDEAKEDTIDGAELSVEKQTSADKKEQQIVPQLPVADVTDHIMKSSNGEATVIKEVVEDKTGKGKSQPPDSKQTDVVGRNDVTEEKAAPRPARRGRRRSSKSAEAQEVKPSPPVESPSKDQVQPVDQTSPATVEVTSRRRRRVRKSSDASKTSGSVSPVTTPDREVGPLVPVKISEVESIPSPTTPPANSVSSPVSPQSIPEIRTEDAQTTRDAVTSGDVIEKKDAAEEKHIKVKRVHSAPTDETVKKTKEANKEQNTTDADKKNNSIEQIKEIETAEKTVKDSQENMAPQTPTEIRYTMNNIDDCQDEAILQRLLSEATNYEDRKRIRSALRAIKKRLSDASDKAKEVSPSRLSPTSPVSYNGRNIAIRTTTEEVRSHVETRQIKNHHEVKTVSDKFSRSTTLISDMSSTTKKVGSIFDREDDEPRRPAPRSVHTDKRREIVRNKSMPASSAKDARRLFVAKLEGGSGAKTGKKVGRSPTFVVPNANNVKQMLLKWCQSKTRAYENVDINNFSGSWANGLAFCALVHNFFPEAFDYSVLDAKNRAHNFELAFDTAQKLANADPLLDVEDMMIMGNRPDSKCVFTYVQSLYNKLRKFEKPLKPLTPTEKQPEPETS